ncbi:DUF4412 domain-containing protein [Marinicella rhabdoformis]|uniref:DUF4412 domain-containing protein n=1 Tax=Marinicella rhabdoformis TaxID=2580566 RepID=UPI0015D01E8D|nr:DUF4412 domain-containing protein [Marinicella rhabdoformis]
MIKQGLLLTGALMVTAVSADTTLVYNNGKGIESSVMHLSDGVMKVISNEGGQQSEVIYHAGQGSFTVVMHDEKKYMTFGPKEIEQLSDISAMVDKMLDKQLANMPESQRAQARVMMEGMIKNQMPKQAPVPEYNKTSESRTINGYSCDVVEKTSKGKSTDDFCVSDYGDLGVSSEEYAAIKAMMKVAEKMASQFGVDTSMNFEQIGEVLPVQYDMNGVKASLVNVSHDDLGKQMFQVPAGYEKQSIPSMGM